MKIPNILFTVSFVMLCFGSFAQQDAASEELTEATATKPEKYREPISFNHQPLLLLKFSPLGMFAHDNMFLMGAELAPPFGKFSFNFDYGIGSGKWNTHKLIRHNMPDMKTEMYKGEIRGYFSDWYPFYALDRKPFGRYWALEYGTKKVTKSPEVAVGNSDLMQYAQYIKVPMIQKEDVLNLKFGRHFLVKKYFFIDVYVGAGVRRYKVTATDPNFDASQAIYFSIINKWKNWLPGDKGFLPNACGGFRLCLPL